MIPCATRASQKFVGLKASERGMAPAGASRAPSLTAASTAIKAVEPCMSFPACTVDLDQVLGRYNFCVGDIAD